MDIKEDIRIVKCDTMAEIDRENVVVGAKQLKKALRDDRVRLVYLAENADPAITEPIAALCRQCGVPVAWIPTKAALGRACHIDVGAAAAAILRST